jgi:hypothetical protein
MLACLRWLCLLAPQGNYKANLRRCGCFNKQNTRQDLFQYFCITFAFSQNCEQMTTTACRGILRAAKLTQMQLMQKTCFQIVVGIESKNHWKATQYIYSRHPSL